MMNTIALVSLLLATPATGSSDAIDLSVWKDPKFQRYFEQSYLAETDIEPTVTLVENEDMQKVLKFMSDERVEKAIELLERKRDPAATAVFDFTLGNIYFQREDYAKAKKLYGAAIDKYPKFRRAWKNLSLIQMRENDYPSVIESLTRVISLGGHDAFNYGFLGFAYERTGNLLSAESAYRMALLLDPATADWKMGMARTLFEQRRYPDASALAASMIAAEPERADLWLLQGNAFLGMGQPLRAAENFEVVERLGGSTAYSLNKLGDIYYNEGIFELSAKAYGKALQLDPAAGVDQALMAAQRMLGRGALDESKLVLAQVKELGGEGLTVDVEKRLLKLRARIAVAEGSGDEEARVLEEIVELDPLDGEALILLGQHSARGEDVEQAIFYFQRAAALEDHEPEAKLQHGRLLVSKSRYEEALPLLKRSQELRPREALAQYLDEVERIARSR